MNCRIEDHLMPAEMRKNTIPGLSADTERPRAVREKLREAPVKEMSWKLSRR